MGWLSAKAEQLYAMYEARFGAGRKWTEEDERARLESLAEHEKMMRDCVETEALFKRLRSNPQEPPAGEVPTDLGREPLLELGRGGVHSTPPVHSVVPGANPVNSRPFDMPRQVIDDVEAGIAIPDGNGKVYYTGAQTPIDHGQDCGGGSPFPSPRGEAEPPTVAIFASPEERLAFIDQVVEDTARALPGLIEQALRSAMRTWAENRWGPYR